MAQTIKMNEDLVKVGNTREPADRLPVDLSKKNQVRINHIQHGQDHGFDGGACVRDMLRHMCQAAILQVEDAVDLTFVILQVGATDVDGFAGAYFICQAQHVLNLGSVQLHINFISQTVFPEFGEPEALKKTRVIRRIVPAIDSRWTGAAFDQDAARFLPVQIKCSYYALQVMLPGPVFSFREEGCCNGVFIQALEEPDDAFTKTMCARGRLIFSAGDGANRFTIPPG